MVCARSIVVASLRVVVVIREVPATPVVYVSIAVIVTVVVLLVLGRPGPARISTGCVALFAGIGKPRGAEVFMIERVARVDYRY